MPEDRFDVPYDEDPVFTGFEELRIDDEVIASILEGTAEELCLMDYESLEKLSANCISKMYKVVDIVCGSVTNPALKKRYNELWAEGVN